MAQAEGTPSPCADACCTRAPLLLPGRDGVDRAPLLRQALRLETVTIAWMLIEAGVAIASGITAGSLVLLAFGLDSVIELISAGLLVWRLALELTRHAAFSEQTERIATRIGAALLFALAAYVTIEAGWRLWIREPEGFAWPGFVVTLAAIPIMRLLAARKLALADQLESRALRTDAVEAITCGWLSLVAVVSLGAQALLGLWWIGSVGALAIA